MIIGAIIALSEVILDSVNLSHPQALLVGLIMSLIVIELTVLVDQRTFEFLQNSHVAVTFVTFTKSPQLLLMRNVA